MIDSACVSSQSVQAVFDEALRLHKSGHLEAASMLYQAILQADPAHADTIHLYGLLAHQNGDSMTAIRRFVAAIRLRPEAAHYRCNLGNALRDLGHIELAADQLRLAQALQPENAEIAANLGTMAFDLGRFDEAIVQYRRALSLDADIPGIRYNLANALRKRGITQEAEKSYQLCLRQAPDFANCHFNLAHLQSDLGQIDQALQSYRVVIDLQPGRTDAYQNLGVLLHQQNHFHDASIVYRKALDLLPPSADTALRRGELLANLGAALAAAGRHCDAIAAFDEAVANDPANRGYRWDRGMSLLALGEFEPGWSDFETRLENAAMPPRLNLPRRWHGQPFAGQTLLITAEQGAGDMIWAARFLPLVKKAGGTLIVECAADLVPLFAAMGCVDRVLLQGENMPPFDWHCSICSVPSLFVASPADLDGASYLAVEQHRIDAIAQLLEPKAGKLRVGVVWSGNTKFPGNANRRTDHFNFLQHFSFSKVQMYSLQKGAPADELADHDRALNQIIDLGPCLANFADTAAAIMSMDLIITVDTAVAHLAGALGKPVWLLLGLAPSWIWSVGRNDSWWYQSMTIFRRSLSGSWDDVFFSAAKELRSLIRSDAS